MDKDRLKKLKERYDSKSHKAYMAYQETGEQRYYREHTNNEELADIIRVAMNAADEHNELINLRCGMSDLGVKARRALNDNDLEEMKLVCRELKSFCQLSDLIQRD